MHYEDRGALAKRRKMETSWYITICADEVDFDEEMVLPCVIAPSCPYCIWPENDFGAPDAMTSLLLEMRRIGPNNAF
jgi:hypothetical protein